MLFLLLADSASPLRALLHLPPSPSPVPASLLSSWVFILRIHLFNTLSLWVCVGGYMCVRVKTRRQPQVSFLMSHLLSFFETGSLPGG